MLKIQHAADDQSVLLLIGRLSAKHRGELAAMLAQESLGRTPVLDLRDLIGVDRPMVSFLRACRARGIVLRNCPDYLRTWIESGKDP